MGSPRNNPRNVSSYPRSTPKVILSELWHLHSFSVILLIWVNFSPALWHSWEQTPDTTIQRLNSDCMPYIDAKQKPRQRKVVLYMGRTILHVCLLCYEDDSSFATDSGKITLLSVLKGHQQYPFHKQHHPALVFPSSSFFFLVSQKSKIFSLESHKLGRAANVSFIIATSRHTQKKFVK